MLNPCSSLSSDGWLVEVYLAAVLTHSFKRFLHNDTAACVKSLTSFKLYRLCPTRISRALLCHWISTPLSNKNTSTPLGSFLLFLPRISPLARRLRSENLPSSGKNRTKIVRFENTLDKGSDHGWHKKTDKTWTSVLPVWKDETGRDFRIPAWRRKIT